MHFKIKKLIAFTIAEVLITLTILGVIATLVIPNMFRNWSDIQTVTNVKKAYAIFNIAISTMALENANSDLRNLDWPTDGTDVSDFFLDKLSKYISFSKKCYTDYGCLPYQNSSSFVYKSLNGERETWIWSQPQTKHGRAVLNNGMTIAIYISNPTGSTNVHLGNTGIIGSIMVDINGAQTPNRVGYDIFSFQIYKNGLTLDLNKFRGLNAYWQYNACSLSTNINANSSNCAIWILRKNNVDYKYRDIKEMADWQ